MTFVGCTKRFVKQKTRGDEWFFVLFFIFVFFFNNKITKTDGRKSGEDKRYVFCKHVSCWFCVNITQTENNKDSRASIVNFYTAYKTYSAHKMHTKGNEYIITYTQ